MRLPFFIGVISLVSLVLGAPTPAPLQPGDLVDVPHKHIQDLTPATAPNMKFDANGKKRPKFKDGYGHPGVVVAAHADGTYDIAHVSKNLPQDAYPHKEPINKYHSALTGDINMGPNTVKVHGSNLKPRPEGPMTPQNFQQLQADRAKFQPPPPAPAPAAHQPSPEPAVHKPEPKPAPQTGEKRKEHSPSPEPESKKQKMA